MPVCAVVFGVRAGCGDGAWRRGAAPGLPRDGWPDVIPAGAYGFDPVPARRTRHDSDKFQQIILAPLT